MCHGKGGIFTIKTVKAPRKFTNKFTVKILKVNSEHRGCWFNSIRKTST